MEFIKERLECVDRRIKNVKRQYWIPAKDSQRLLSDKLVASNEIKDGDRLFLRYGSLLDKIIAEGILAKGKPTADAKLVTFSPRDIHTICTMSHVIPRTDEAKVATDIVATFRGKILAWLDGEGTETFNEIFTF